MVEVDDRDRWTGEGAGTVLRVCGFSGHVGDDGGGV